MDKIILIQPSKEYEQQVKEFIKEFLDNNSKINGTGDLENNTENYDAWL